jgi:hypothetical protein
MTARPPCPASGPLPGLLARLLRDGAGNTLAMVAAALLPLIGLLGGGIDMGRGYLSQSRLQQACDAGVLAARKRLGTDVAVSGEIPEEAAETGPATGRTSSSCGWPAPPTRRSPGPAAASSPPWPPPAPPRKTSWSTPPCRASTP